MYINVIYMYVYSGIICTGHENINNLLLIYL